MKRLAERCLKENKAGRVDQFQVFRRLDGLQEKFQVVGNDRLADALHLRLSELDTKSCHWAPEALFLLLELSDQPATKSSPDKVALFQPPDSPPVLKWSDFGSSELDQGNIWEDIDYADGSSDDNVSLASSDVSIPRIVPQAVKVPLDEHLPPEDVFLDVENEELVSSIQNAQAWRALAPASNSLEEPTVSLTELQVIRESIFMLQGLPNSLYRNVNEIIEVDCRFSLSHSSSEAFGSILRSFVDIGVCIQKFRVFDKLPQKVPFMQMFQRELEDLVSEFDRFLSDIQAKYTTKEQCVSVIELLNDIRIKAKLLIELAGLVTNLERSKEHSGFVCLDMLYDLVCVKQATAEDVEFEILARLFFKCFESYSRPIRKWMRTGVLDESLGTFFVKDSGKRTSLKYLWHEWFIMEEVSGKLYGPKFLHPAAKKIFTTGKSMIFLRHLGINPESIGSNGDHAIGFEETFLNETPSPLTPFSGLVEGAFERIVNAYHTLASSALRIELDQKCSLWLSMQALEYIYMGKDTSLLAIVDQRIFDLIDKGRPTWNDRFLLTENFQQALGTIPCVDASRLIARSIKVSPREFEKHCRSVKILKAISLDYVLPWPVANIISKEEMIKYQRLSIFLMQIRRAKYALEKQSANKPRYLRTEPHVKDEILSFALRYHLLWFLNILYFHFTEMVIASSSASMRKAMSEVKDVDAMIAVHRSFAKSLEVQCLLSKPIAPIYQAVISILDLCMQFSDVQAARYAEYQQDQANLSSTYLLLPSSRYHRRHRQSSQAGHDETTSDESEEEEHPNINDTMFGDGNSTCISLAELSYKERVIDIRAKFDQLCNFVRAGLRGIGRFDDQSSWEMLADRLEWKREAFI